MFGSAANQHCASLNENSYRTPAVITTNIWMTWRSDPPLSILLLFYAHCLDKWNKIFCLLLWVAVSQGGKKKMYSPSRALSQSQTQGSSFRFSRNLRAAKISPFAQITICFLPIHCHRRPLAAAKGGRTRKRLNSTCGKPARKSKDLQGEYNEWEYIKKIWCRGILETG